MLDESSLLISNEVIRTRASILEENMVRWGYTNNWVTSNDPKEFGKLEGYFDLIVVDAPCSGSGLFRKDERALDEWSEANVLLCHQRQQRIIADVWNALKENGFLIYATCSYSTLEDENILDWLSENFSVSPVNVTFPKEWGIVTTSSKTGLRGYRFFPDKVNGEGFFIAALQKKETTRLPGLSKFKTLRDKKAAEQSGFLLNKEKDFAVLKGKEGFIAIDQQHEPDLHLLSKVLYLRKAGVALGMPANKEWLPAHDVALSIDRSCQIAAIAVTREQALRFLKKEEMNLSLNEKGWLLITYEGLGLGWIKSLGNRLNNYLPKHWRIRMELPSEW
jgi:NOL1/NOP2/fmu family ribosome biogenesis protein